MKDEIQAVIWTQGQHIRELIKTFVVLWERKLRRANTKQETNRQWTSCKTAWKFFGFTVLFLKDYLIGDKDKTTAATKGVASQARVDSCRRCARLFLVFVNSVCWCWLEAAGWLCWRRELSARSELRKENDTSLTDVCAVSGSAAGGGRLSLGKRRAVAKKERRRRKIHKTRETHQIRRKDWKQTERQVEKIDFCSRTCAYLFWSITDTFLSWEDN